MESISQEIICKDYAIQNPELNKTLKVDNLHARGINLSDYLVLLNEKFARKLELRPNIRIEAPKTTLKRLFLLTYEVTNMFYFRYVIRYWDSSLWSVLYLSLMNMYSLSEFKIADGFDVIAANSNYVKLPQLEIYAFISNRLQEYINNTLHNNPTYQKALF
jgi:hypothetical protein